MMRLDTAKTGLAMALLVLSLWTLCDQARAKDAQAQTMLPAFVSINRVDAVYGLQHHECWLTYFQYYYPTMVIDCHSDIDAIFANGFELLPGATPR